MTAGTDPVQQRLEKYKTDATNEPVKPDTRSLFFHIHILSRVVCPNFGDKLSKVQTFTSQVKILIIGRINYFEKFVNGL